MILALTLTCLSLSHAQQRDIANSQPAPTAQGTAVVSGLVVTADSQHQPIRGAIVTLLGPALPAGRSSITNDDGRFSIGRVPAGRYSLTATTPAYLTTEYGATRPGRSGIPLLITDAQRVAGITLTMPHGAAITGVITDQESRPIPGADVSVLRVDRNGRDLSVTTAVQTDDRGVYRAFGLAPGNYVVAISRDLGAAPANPAIGAMSTAAVDDVLNALKAQHSVDRAARQPAAIEPTAPYGPAPVYYPGAASVADATRIALAPGDERTGVDITFALTKMAAIEGIVVSPNGVLPSLQIAVNSDALQTPTLSSMDRPVLSTRPGADGRFKITNVPPGSYAIIARTTTAMPGPRAAPAPQGIGPPVFASADVVVTGDDVTGLVLTLQPALTVSGRVTLDRGTSAAAPDLSKVMLNLTDATLGDPGIIGGMLIGGVPITPAGIREDGSFEITGLVPATYRLTTTLPLTSGWWLRSAIVGGKDMLDTGLEVKAGGDISGAVLTFSDRHSSLSGTLQVPASQTASSYFIVVYPADRSMWRPQGRRIKSARPGTDGTFIIKDLPAGDYLLAALTDVEPDDLSDPAFFDQLLGASATVTIGEGEQKTQDLMIRGSDPLLLNGAYTP